MLAVPGQGLHRVPVSSSIVPAVHAAASAPVRLCGLSVADVAGLFSRNPGGLAEVAALLARFQPSFSLGGGGGPVFVPLSACVHVPPRWRVGTRRLPPRWGRSCAFSFAYCSLRLACARHGPPWRAGICVHALGRMPVGMACVIVSARRCVGCIPLAAPPGRGSRHARVYAQQAARRSL